MDQIEDIFIESQEEEKKEESKLIGNNNGAKKQPNKNVVYGGRQKIDLGKLQNKINKEDEEGKRIL